MKSAGLSQAEIDARHAEKAAKRRAARAKIMATKTVEKGLLIVHTGKGKGKSTAAFGMVMRCLGHGLRVGVVQFVKGRWETGERGLLERFPDLVTIKTMGMGFTWECEMHWFYQRMAYARQVLGTPEELRSEAAAFYLEPGVASSVPVWL